MTLINRRQGGVTIIEVMIAILMLAMGLLGVLGLVTRSMQFSSSANYRTIAAQQSYAMAEILRSNPSMLDQFRDLPAAGAVPVASCFQNAGCTTTANWTSTAYGQWRLQLAAILPSGSGYVCRDSVADNLAANADAPSTDADWMCDNAGSYVVKVCWNESRAAIGAFAGGAMCVWTTL